MKCFLLLCGVFGLQTACVAAPDEPPNIVLVMADDQGWGDMGYNGHPHLKTPNFDALAKEGVRFDEFHAAAPVCSPTRGSVMTGRTPNRFGCFSWGHALRPQEIALHFLARIIALSHGLHKRSLLRSQRGLEWSRINSVNHLIFFGDGSIGHALLQQKSFNARVNLDHARRDGKAGKHLV